MPYSSENFINIDEVKGGDFLHKKNSALHMNPFVEFSVKARENSGQKAPQKPAEKIATWLRVLEKTHLSHRDDPRVMGKIKEYYHKQRVIKPENVPNNYFDTQKRMYRERGYGEVEITEEMKREQIEILIKDQEASLDKWIDYLTCSDADVYPFWVKYWVFEGVSKLSSFDKEQNKFKKRDEKTVGMFPDLNREALGMAVNLIIKKVHGEKVLDDEASPQFKKMIGNASFGEFYALSLADLQRQTESQESLSVVEGKWVKYDRGSDHMALVKSIEGHNTGWCTAGESTAKAQLKGGDFYVYYSNDSEGMSTVPRVAIRMSGSTIGEIRGIAKDQNLDPFMGQKVEEKLKEFPDRERYLKKTEDMKRLTEIDNRAERGEEISVVDLRFLYEIDEKILGFGYEKDPRIQNILLKRNKRRDLAKIFNLAENQISTTPREALENEILFHYGDLKISLTTPEGLKLPERMMGDLDLGSLTTADGLILPKGIKYLNLQSLTTADGLILPDGIEQIHLSSLTTAKGLIFPESIESLDLPSLITVDGLILPKEIKWLYLGSLTTADGLILPEGLERFYSPSITTADGLILPKGIKSLYLPSLTTPDGLKLPEMMSGDIDLCSLTTARGLIFPEEIGSLDLHSLTTSDGMKLPKRMKGDLDLSSLTTADGLILPKGIKYLNLQSLTTAAGLKFSEGMESLNLSSLTTVDGLILPKGIKRLDLSSLTTAAGLILPGSEIKLIARNLTEKDKEILFKEYPNMRLFW